MATESRHWESRGQLHRERRKYPRVPTDQVLTIAPQGRAGVSARGRDVSPGGIQFQVIGCEIALGESLKVTFQVGETCIVASGRVVWATENDAWITDVGLEFDRVEGDGLARLQDMIWECEPAGLD